VDVYNTDNISARQHISGFINTLTATKSLHYTTTLTSTQKEQVCNTTPPQTAFLQPILIHTV